MSKIAQEIVFRVHKTSKGYKVSKYDGTGLADGVFTKPYTRYFYGDDGEEKAHDYARRKAEELDDETRVVELGERW